MKYFAIILLVAVSFNLSAQGSKYRSKKLISSQTCWKKNMETGDKEYIQSVEKYDRAGEISEQIKYDVTGKIEDHEKYEYDADGNRIKKTNLDKKGDVKSYVVMTYDNNKLIREEFFDAAGKLKKSMEYEYSGKLLVRETEKNSSGKVSWEKNYKYTHYEEQ